MLGRNRKAWMVPACLSLKTTPQMVFNFNYQICPDVNFCLQVSFAKNTFSLGKIATEKDAKGKKSDNRHFDIQCLPLTAILLALNRTEVDYFSLDIEGHELDVLRAIDYDQIDIKA